MIKGKNTIRVGGNVVERYREPPNPGCADRMTQYIFDYKNLKSWIPDNRAKTLVEAGPGPKGVKNVRTQSSNPSTNRSASYGPIRGVNLGATPDDPGKF
jgi:hypothetical protein